MIFSTYNKYFIHISVIVIRFLTKNHFKTFFNSQRAKSCFTSDPCATHPYRSYPRQRYHTITFTAIEKSKPKHSFFCVSRNFVFLRLASNQQLSPSLLLSAFQISKTRATVSVRKYIKSKLRGWPTQREKKCAGTMSNFKSSRFSSKFECQKKGIHERKS